MKKPSFLLPFIALFIAPRLYSQGNNNDVLLTIGNDKITVAEFLSVYKKNNTKESIDQKSLQEYLQLYINFRLKVAEAKEMHLDTARSFVEELKGYRKQLSQPYLTDKNTSEALLKEAYDRMKWDIRASHILVSVPAEALPKDTLEGYQRIMIIRNFVLGKSDPKLVKDYENLVKMNLNISKTSSPADTMAAHNKLKPIRDLLKSNKHAFAEAAKTLSDDPGMKQAAGDLGYFTAFNMVYSFETAAYNLKVGELSMPIRTQYGYHLVKVTDRKPHSEVHVAHIMIKHPKDTMNTDTMARHKKKIMEIADSLKAGKSFEQMAMKYSEDPGSAKKGGELNWFSWASPYPAEFKEASYALGKDNDISGIVKTRFGWHLIKRLGTRPLMAYEEMQGEIKNKVAKDTRSQKGRETLIANLKKTYNFKEDRKAVDELLPLLDTSFAKGRWSAEKTKKMTKMLFSIADKKYTQADLGAYIEAHQAPRQKMDEKQALNNMYRQYVDESIVNYEEGMLDSKYPDFKMLMDEYRDGILLFDLTDKKVWSKAVKDTVGLKVFYDKNKPHFMWEERADATVYSCADKATADKVKKLIAQKKSDGDILTAVNEKSQLKLSVDPRLFQKGENDLVDKSWVPGFTGEKTDNGKIVFAYIRKLVPPSNKTLTEAKGLVTAEYQAQLEKEWLESLKKKYSVMVNQKVFEGIK